MVTTEGPYDYDRPIIDYGGPNQVTIHAAIVEESIDKKLLVILNPQSSSQQENNSKVVTIYDFGRVSRRFTITGHIDSSDVIKLRTVAQYSTPQSVETARNTKLLWAGENPPLMLSQGSATTPTLITPITGTIESCKITRDSRSEGDEFAVTITFIEGVKPV